MGTAGGDIEIPCTNRTLFAFLLNWIQSRAREQVLILLLYTPVGDGKCGAINLFVPLASPKSTMAGSGNSGTIGFDDPHGLTAVNDYHSLSSRTYMYGGKRNNATTNGMWREKLVHVHCQLTRREESKCGDTCGMSEYLHHLNRTFIRNWTANIWITRSTTLAMQNVENMAL